MKHNRQSRTNLVQLLIHPILFLSFFTGCAIFQSGGRPSDPVEALRYDIAQVLSDSIFVPAHASVKIISLETNEVLFERNSKLLTRPASNMKLLTSSAALKTLGLGHTFKTSVLVERDAENPSVCSNVYLKGYGDPDLGTTDLDSLAAQVERAGIKAICGSVLADVAYFDDEFWGYGWNWDDEPSSYAPFLSALAANDNCVKVTVSAAEIAGRAVNVTITPPTSYVTLLNNAVTVRDTAVNQLRVTRLFKERLNTIAVSGEMKVGDRPIEREISVWRPELYAATLFQEALQRRGIFVAGKPRVGITTARAQAVASASRGIIPAVINLNKVSDNLTAEMFLKTLSAETEKVPGSSRGGITVMHRVLSGMGIDTTKYQLADGSGLSFYNLISADMIIQLLREMAQQKEIFPTFLESLPIAGVDGTIRTRMRQTPAQGNLRAKTGTINGVSSLSGYVQTLDGERLAFSMLMQNFTWPTRLYTRAQDRIGALLAGFSRHGKIAQAKP